MSVVAHHDDVCRSILDHVEGTCTWDTFGQSFCLFLSPAPWFKAPVVPNSSNMYPWIFVTTDSQASNLEHNDNKQ